MKKIINPPNFGPPTFFSHLDYNSEFSLPFTVTTVILRTEFLILSVFITTVQPRSVNN